jgi:hypothetical protein
MPLTTATYFFSMGRSRLATRMATARRFARSAKGIAARGRNGGSYASITMFRTDAPINGSQDDENNESYQRGLADGRAAAERTRGALNFGGGPNDARGALNYGTPGKSVIVSLPRFGGQSDYAASL